MSSWSHKGNARTRCGSAAQGTAVRIYCVIASVYLSRKRGSIAHKQLPHEGPNLGLPARPPRRAYPKTSVSSEGSALALQPSAVDNVSNTNQPNTPKNEPTIECMTTKRPLHSYRKHGCHGLILGTDQPKPGTPMAPTSTRAVPQAYVWCETPACGTTAGERSGWPGALPRI